MLLLTVCAWIVGMGFAIAVALFLLGISVALIDKVMDKLF